MNESKLLWPAALILAGALVMLDPSGKVHRIPYVFGDYKYAAGVLLIAAGIWLGFRLRRPADPK